MPTACRVDGLARTEVHDKRVAKGGVLAREIASGAPAEVGGDAERFRGSRKRGQPVSEAAGLGEDAGGDVGDCHGIGSTTKAAAAPGSRAQAIHVISHWT